MVLQREPYNAIIWGYANINSIIGTVLNGKLYSTTSVRETWSSQYIWTLKLDPIVASNTPINIQLTETRPDGISSITIRNVLFGDVWICSGQSNMQLSLLGSFNGTEEANSGAQYSNIRIMTASQRSSPTPLYDLISTDQNWTVPSASSLGNGVWSFFSATCWHFGKSLNKNLNIPIGLITTAWGGTNIEKWTTSKVIEDCGAAKGGDDQTLWNAMIHPFFKLTIFGAIWYQGESNTGYNRDQYSCTFPRMINDWVSFIIHTLSKTFLVNFLSFLIYS
jgi:sialate O-acetylesterase